MTSNGRRSETAKVRAASKAMQTALTRLRCSRQRSGLAELWFLCGNFLSVNAPDPTVREMICSAEKSFCCAIGIK